MRILTNKTLVICLFILKSNYFSISFPRDSMKQLTYVTNIGIRGGATAPCLRKLLFWVSFLEILIGGTLMKSKIFYFLNSFIWRIHIKNSFWWLFEHFDYVYRWENTEKYLKTADFWITSSNMAQSPHLLSLCCKHTFTVSARLLLCTYVQSYIDISYEWQMMRLRLGRTCFVSWSEKRCHAWFSRWRSGTMVSIFLTCFSNSMKAETSLGGPFRSRMRSPSTSIFVHLATHLHAKRRLPQASSTDWRDWRSRGQNLKIPRS